MTRRTDAVRCRYSDCRHPEANEAERVTCPDCRADLGLPPLDRMEAATALAALYSEWKKHQAKAIRNAEAIGKRPHESAMVARWADRAETVRGAAFVLGLQAEFDRALLESKS